MRTTREHLNLTQAELGGRLGLNQSTISRMEAGTLPIDERTKLALSALRLTAPVGPVCETEIAAA